MKTPVDIYDPSGTKIGEGYVQTLPDGTLRVVVDVFYDLKDSPA